MSGVNPYDAAVETAAAELNAVLARRRWWRWWRDLGHEESRRYRNALMRAALYELSAPPTTQPRTPAGSTEETP